MLPHASRLEKTSVFSKTNNFSILYEFLQVSRRECKICLSNQMQQFFFTNASADYLWMWLDAFGVGSTQAFFFALCIVFCDFSKFTVFRSPPRDFRIFCWLFFFLARGNHIFLDQNFPVTNFFLTFWPTEFSKLKSGYSQNFIKTYQNIVG